MSLRLGIWITTRPFTLKSQALPRCRPLAAPLPGGCSSRSAVRADRHGIPCPAHDAFVLHGRRVGRAASGIGRGILYQSDDHQKINRTREHGGRIIAVGTTVVRALESVADEDGRVAAGHGYTQLRITPAHKLKAVSGLLTGLHEPEASHLDLLAAFLPPEQIREAYEEAVRSGLSLARVRRFESDPVIKVMRQKVAVNDRRRSNSDAA